MLLRMILYSMSMCRTSASKPMAQFRAPLAPLLGPLPTGHTAAPTTRLRSGRRPGTRQLAAPTHDTLRRGTSGGRWLGPRPHHAGNTRAAHTPNRWLKFLHEPRREPAAAYLGEIFFKSETFFALK